MTNQYSEVSYIAAADADVPAAASSVDYRSDFVAEITKQIRKVISRHVSQIHAAKAVSPQFNVHEILDTQKLEQYRKFFSSLDKYHACARGWSNANAVGPSANQLESATKAVAMLMMIGAPAPTPMMLDDGTIGAYWRSGHKYASIDFDADGEHPWAGTDGANYWSGVWETNGELPDLLKAELKSIIRK